MANLKQGSIFLHLLAKQNNCEIVSDLQKFGLISDLVTAFMHNVLVSKITLASFCLTSACAQ